jgi:hypothetical protein
MNKVLTVSITVLIFFAIPVLPQADKQGTTIHKQDDSLSVKQLSSQSKMPEFTPDPDINYKITEAIPDTTIDYKILISDPSEFDINVKSGKIEPDSLRKKYPFKPPK